MIWTDVAKVVLFVVGYLFLTWVILPKLGVPT
jgi:hypothetical protein